MFNLLQIATTLLVAIAMALALAHALELPRKMRLNQDTYYATQTIYYPGFTIGGISELVSIILMVTLLWLAPAGSAEFWLTLLALIGLIGMQAVYWLITHPVNQFWVEGESLDRFSSIFSPLAPALPAKRTPPFGRSCAIAGNIPTSPEPSSGF